MPTKFERERDAERLARHQRVAEQIKQTDQQMSRDTSRTLLLYTGDVVPDPDQPRRFYDEDASALQELANSIRAVGVLSPIQVRPDPQVQGQYIIIVGERRWRACQLAGVNRIEAVVRDDWDPFQIRAAQYEENEKRQDVSDVARARSLTAMRQADGSGRRRGWEEVAERVGLQRNQAMRLVGLLQLPGPVVELIDRRLLPGTHGTELVRLLKHVPDEEILALARRCCATTPGGKASVPVKELARLITDRLQAAHEAAQKQQDADSIMDLDVESKNDAATASDMGAALPQGLGVLVEPNGSEEEGEDVTSLPPDKRAETSETDSVRPFVLQLVEVWRADQLSAREQELLQEMIAHHPLGEAPKPKPRKMHH